MRKPPTHEKVAEVLRDEFPRISEMILEDEKRNCWGDLTFRVQREFSPKDVARVFRRLALNGWEWCIVATWCPYDDELWRIYSRARDLQGEFFGMEKKAKKLRAVTLHGAIGLMRHFWTERRKSWMEERGISGDNDPSFFDQILFYLDRRELADAASNG